MLHPYSIPELSAILAPIAKKHGVRRVSVFGSVARGDAHAGSDVDLCIDAGAIESLLGLIAFRLDAEEALHASVDLVTTDSNDRKFLSMIKPDEVVLYEDQSKQ